MVEDQPWTHSEEWKEYGHNSPFLSSLRLISYGRDEPVRVESEDLEKLVEDGFRRVVYDRSIWMSSPKRTNIDPETKLTEALGPPMFKCQSGSVWSLSVPLSLGKATGKR